MLFPGSLAPGHVNVYYLTITLPVTHAIYCRVI